MNRIQPQPDLAIVPSSAINDGARKGVRDAILALKARVEGMQAPAHDDSP
jgi:hypothetical protein